MYATIRYALSTTTFYNSRLKDGDGQDPVVHISTLSSLVAGLLATILSSPFNYARNMQYDTPIELKQKSMYFYLRYLARRATEEKRPLAYLQRRLRIGWGSLRVAVGMGVGNMMYDKLKVKYEDIVSR